MMVSQARVIAKWRLLHAENIVETEFLLSPLHQKAVRIEEKDHGEDQDDSAAKSQNLLENNCADHIVQAGILGEGQHDIVYCCCDHTGEQIGHNRLTVLL